jgi:hypothetical protein
VTHTFGCKTATSCVSMSWCVLYARLFGVSVCSSVLLLCSSGALWSDCTHGVVLLMPFLTRVRTHTQARVYEWWDCRLSLLHVQVA